MSTFNVSGNVSAATAAYERKRAAKARLAFLAAQTKARRPVVQTVFQGPRTPIVRQAPLLDDATDAEENASVVVAPAPAKGVLSNPLVLVGIAGAALYLFMRRK